MGKSNPEADPRRVKRLGGSPNFIRRGKNNIAHVRDISGFSLLRVKG